MLHLVGRAARVMWSRGRALRRWARSFTRLERGLLLAAAALGAALPALLVLLALHLGACPALSPNTAVIPPTPLVGGPPKSTAIKSTRCTATGWETLAVPDPESRISTRCSAIGLPEDSTETPTNATRAPDVLASEPPDGETVDEREYGFVLALVKVRPSGITFGCVLSMLTPHWTVTAASCIDSIEEVDSLDSFVMMEGYGRGAGRAVAVGWVRVHPRYGAGVDLALLRAADALRGHPARLASALDLHRVTIGERLMLLGFGKFRSVEADGARRLRAAGVRRLPAAACAGGGGGAPRHLRPAPAAAARAARCAAAPVCTGVLFARAQPCQYCAGAALVWRGALAGVAGAAGAAGAAGDGCGAACEPAPAHLLAADAWLRAATVEHDDYF